MTRWIRWSIGATGAVLGGAIAASAVATALWSRATARAVEGLASAPGAEPAGVYSPDEIRGLRARSPATSSGRLRLDIR